jgi:neutral ceramidase
MGSQLQAGVARADTTPPIGVAHANWGAQTHQRARGIDLPLWTTALALSDGDETCVIVDVDIIGIREPEINHCRELVAQRTGLPLSNIRVSYTHTHSGPTGGASQRASWTTEGTEMAPAYQEELRYQIAGVAWAALQDLQPVRFESGSGQSTIAINRRFARPEDDVVIVGRNWDGVVDHEVKVVRLDTLDGDPLAAVVNYACHPIVVGPDGDLITPDYPGVVKRAVESATGATCLFLQGATGDVGPVRGGARNGLTEYRRLGTILGLEASRVWWETEVPRREEEYLGTLESGAPLAIYRDNPVEHTVPNGGTMLRVGIREMRLPVKQFRSADERDAEFEQAFQALNRLRESGGSDEAIRHQTMLCKRASMRASLSRQNQGQTHRALEIQAIVLGNDTALVAIPGEPFVSIGMQVKQGSPFPHTLFSGYTNVGGGYIPMPEDYPLGGYEVEVSPFTEDAAQVVVDECLALLRELEG